MLFESRKKWFLPVALTPSVTCGSELTAKPGWVVVDFGDRWDSKQGYDYQLSRTTNAWRIVGVGGYRKP